MFSNTRFPNSVRAVFDTLIDDYKPVVDCLRDIIANNTGSSKEEKNRSDDAKAILRKVLSKSFVLQLSGTSDIYENFGHIANLCQVVDLLPHERYDSVMRRIGWFDTMLSQVSHSKCPETIKTIGMERELNVSGQDTMPVWKLSKLTSFMDLLSLSLLKRMLLKLLS